ncbi:MAG: peptidase and subtilisin kexin sedolisin [Deltaproteobacteria bacterium]|nr:peptidase and subtilisin kexin sedolisin [Deltaproteobacteria bacterium]
MHPRRFAGSVAGAALLLYGLLSLSGTFVEPDFRKVEPRLLHADAVATGSARGRASDFASAAVVTAIPMFIRLGEDDPDLPGKIGNLGGTAHRISPRVYTARLPVDKLRYVSNWPSVSYIEAGRRVRPVLNLSRPAVFADLVQAGTGLPGNIGYTGLGALVGIVDTGLDGTHPDFNAGAPSASRVVHTFSFSGGISALSDTHGHGTLVTGIAAGNGRASDGEYTGMAKDAQIMVGRAGISDFLDTDLINGVADLFGYAETVAVKPAAVNLSLGVVDGPHDGTSSFEAAINDLATGEAGSRRLVAVAAGNEQDTGEHFRVTLPAFGSSTASLSILPHSSVGDAIVDIWADGEDRFTVTAVRGAESVAATSGTTASSSSRAIFIANRTDDPPNHATHVEVFFTPPSGSGISASVRLDRVRNGGNGQIDGYIDFLSGNFTGSGVSSTGTTIEPANGNNVVAVGSFRTKTSGGGADTPGISAFSSTGPTRDGRTKPDIAAPGEVIYSARSSQGSFFPSEIVPGDNNYVITAGTSMATPHVSGIAALVWQSNPGLTGAQMRERLRRTADPVGASPNTTWGFGKANALRAVRETVASISGPVRATPGSPVFLTSGNSSGGFGAAISGYLWSAPGASLTSRDQSGTTFTASTPGIYAVFLTASAGGASGSDSRNILVNTFPTATFTVPPSDNAGQSVTFRGTASDADHQPLAFHWVLVSRPAGSRASIAAANLDNAVFTPDAPGTYEIGLRVDDGLDNSALVVRSYTALGSTTSPTSSDGGGGGCLSIARSGGGPADFTSLVSVGILLLPACALGVRRFFHRRKRTVPIRHSLC